MKSKHKFTPGQVVPMEERALLSSFKFPAVMGPVTTLGLHGKFVLTSRVYANVQNQVNKDINSFIKTVIKIYSNPSFSTIVGIGTLGTGPNGGYASGTLLAKLDSQLAHQEFSLPYGAGYANVTGGVGLSVATAATTTNPASVHNSVAELMEDAITGTALLSSPTMTAQGALAAMNTVRAETLAIYASHGGPGLLPDYVEAFGPAGSHLFGLRNSN